MFFYFNGKVRIANTLTINTLSVSIVPTTWKPYEHGSGGNFAEHVIFHSSTVTQWGDCVRKKKTTVSGRDVQCRMIISDKQFGFWIASRVRIRCTRKANRQNFARDKYTTTNSFAHLMMQHVIIKYAFEIRECTSYVRTRIIHVQD